jgi:hypothetical protein
MKRLLAAAIVVLTTSTLAAQQPGGVEQPKISVSGEALVYAKPD